MHNHDVALVVYICTALTKRKQTCYHVFAYLHDFHQQGNNFTLYSITVRQVFLIRSKPGTPPSPNHPRYPWKGRSLNQPLQYLLKLPAPGCLESARSPSHAGSSAPCTPRPGAGDWSGDEGCLVYEEGLMSVCSRDQHTRMKSEVEPINEVPNMSPRYHCTKNSIWLIFFGGANFW